MGSFPLSVCHSRPANTLYKSDLEGETTSSVQVKSRRDTRWAGSLNHYRRVERLIHRIESFTDSWSHLILHLERSILSSFTLPHVTPVLYYFLSAGKHKWTLRQCKEKKMAIYTINLLKLKKKCFKLVVLVMKYLNQGRHAPVFWRSGSGSFYFILL